MYGLDLALQNGAVFILTDQNGIVVHSSDPSAPNEMIMSEKAKNSIEYGGTYYIPYTRYLQNAQWNYSLLVPVHILYEEQQRLLLTLIWLVLSILLAGAVMSIVFSVFNVRPLRQMLKSLSCGTTSGSANGEWDSPLWGGNEYVSLSSRIQAITSNNESLQKEALRHAEFSRLSFLDRLLKTGFSSPEEMNTMAHYAGVIMEYRGYILTVFQLTGHDDGIQADLLEEMELDAAVITGFLKENTGRNALAHKTDHNRIALLFCLDRHGQDVAVREDVARIIAAAEGQLDIGLRCVVSNEIPDTGALMTAYYMMCRQLQDPDNTHPESIQILRAKEAFLESYHYPLDIESRLLRSILSGSADEAEEILKRIFLENIEVYEITMPFSLHFLNAIRGTLIRAKNEIKLDTPEDEAAFNQVVYTRGGTELTGQLEELVSIVKMLCKAVQAKAERKNTRVIERIDQFIGENYQDGNLSLSLIAREMMLTENYVSHLYKSVTGENISTRIESRRMKQAELLLRETGRAIKEIAYQVGYPNLNTFYKAFRRVYGISPKGYYDKVHDSVKKQ